MTFNQQTYLQIDGTAMGSSLSVTYACLYMAHKEQLAINRFLHGGYQPLLMYYRMVDDIAAILADGTQAVAFMQTIINEVDEGIKFEYQIKANNMIFMDLEIYKNDEFTTTRTPSTRLYQKPMNKYLFLPYQSQHPLHVFKSWIICYIKRIRILCSENIDYYYNKDKFKERLLSRAYPRQFLDKIFNANYNREQLIQQYTQKKHNNIKTNSGYKSALRLSYNGFTKKYARKIKECMKFTDELKQDPHFQQIFGKRNTPMVTHKTTNNIGQILIQSELAPAKVTENINT